MLLYNPHLPNERKTKIVPLHVMSLHNFMVWLLVKPNHGIDDVWFCNELNGPFLRLKIN